jgi:tetratricopeptide (TPR) repeat protein
VKVNAGITSKGSITLDSMNLPDKKHYMEVLPVMERPAVLFKIDFFPKEKHSDNLWPYENLISTAEHYRGKGFEKVMFSINLHCGENIDKVCQALRFKLTKELPAPGVNSISKLVIKSGDSPVGAEVSAIYSRARKLHESGNYKEALPLYLKVVQKNDNPYRYDAYAPVESGFVIESAFYAAEIENETGNRDHAKRLYSLAAERIKYFEVKAEYIEIERKAQQYLREIK